MNLSHHSLHLISVNSYVMITYVQVCSKRFHITFCKSDHESEPPMNEQSEPWEHYRSATIYEYLSLFATLQRQHYSSLFATIRHYSRSVDKTWGRLWCRPWPIQRLFATMSLFATIRTIRYSCFPDTPVYRLN